MMSAMAGRNMKQRLLARVQGSRSLTCLAFAADNMLAAAGLIGSDPAPSEHLSGADIEADIQYAKAVAAIYERGGPLRGRVAEVGPGGSAAVALQLIARGCNSVDLLDRFSFPHSRDRLTAVYAEAIARDPRLSEIVTDPQKLAPTIRHFAGETAAAEIFFQTNMGYDAIVSCAVLEHLYDPLRAIEAMAAALAPGGRLIHQIDLRDHGMFTAGGQHELTFLTVSSWFWPHMTRRRGRPNRVLAHRYQETLDRLGLKCRMMVTHLVGVGEIVPAEYQAIPIEQREIAEAHVNERRSHMASEFRSLPVEVLATSSIWIEGIKSL